MLHKLQNLLTKEKCLGKSNKINKEILAFKIINLLKLGICMRFAYFININC